MSTSRARPHLEEPRGAGDVRARCFLCAWTTLRSGGSRRLDTNAGLGLVKGLLQPKAIAGLVLGAVGLGFVLSFADLSKVGQELAHFPPVLLPLIFSLIAIREAIRVVEWQFLLRALGARPWWRHSWLALLGGDTSQILPAGIYFENYLLEREEGVDAGFSVAATGGMLLLEAVVALAVLAVLGVPGWLWVRPVSLLIMAGYAVFLGAISRPGVVDWLRRRSPGNRFASWALDRFRCFLECLARLMDPRVSGRAAALTAAYLAATVGTFYVAARVYALPGVGIPEAAAIYSFVLAIVILNPLPSDLGIAELSGVGILLAFGVAPAVGLTVMLITRFSVLLSTAMLTAVSFVLLRTELKHLAAGPRIGEHEPWATAESLTPPASSRP